MNPTHHFVKVTSATNKVVVGNPQANGEEIARILQNIEPCSDIVLFPELNVTGYTCGKLFHQNALLDSALETTLELAKKVGEGRLVVVGIPLRVGNALFNCAAVLNNRNIIGIVPKEFIPNYNEFYEGRWFASARDDGNSYVDISGSKVPFGTDLLFRAPVGDHEAVVSIEICESIWMPIPPSSFSAIAGANILLNPSASNETIGKPDYRRNLVIGQSGRCIAAYAYASSGPTESTSDLVFGGHCLIAENGHMMEESDRVGDGKTPNRGSYWITTDIDVEKIQTERRITTSYNESRRYLKGKCFRDVNFILHPNWSFNDPPQRKIEAHPFIPKEETTLKARCAEIFGIQTCALAKRLEQLGHEPKVVIGVSGGLDSTLALMVAVKTFDMLDLPRENICGITMPGFGTTHGTRNNATVLMDSLGIRQKEIDIRPSCLQIFRDIEHKPFSIDVSMLNDGAKTDVHNFCTYLSVITPEQRKKGDLVFENVQARQRTLFLMSHGFVLGTGDMSELWLGWCTYNGDQQSMYNVNCSVPKTLVSFLVEYIAKTETIKDCSNPLYVTLMDIANTVISPELLPTNQGEIEQSTEDSIGPYELHDFFMFHFVKNGFDPAKILYLAKHAKWNKEYTFNEIKHWLKINIKRAFQQQYKRDNIPNGPKIGTVSLSPRGDWRMPSDASPQAWLNTLETL